MDGEIITKEKYPEICKWLRGYLKISDRKKYDAKFYRHLTNNDFNYFKLKNNKLDADCDVWLNEETSIIKYPFGVVNGDFICKYNNNINSLKGFPEIVNGHFDCCYCSNLKSLKYCPKIIERGFNLKFYTSITSLKGCPEVINEYFVCTDCKNLKSFIGGPKKINDVFICYDCPNITSLEGFPKYVRSSVYFKLTQFSNNPNEKEKYNRYINIWMDFLESISEKDKIEYLNNYKDKEDLHLDNPIIPKEIINKYKIDYLLRK